ncbi:hypothetical protein KIPB_010075 [Kipferlia bialata]|uniref:Uncharacterized protein n=1 Tax=Kipferlia bialata TaxID=797122 RepID=A0A9K3GMR1_9EUKA|nr:hypothetical protein KIPB_010075 [Kipferlia bialata]|eukprot:g10075.t1
MRGGGGSHERMAEGLGDRERDRERVEIEGASGTILTAEVLGDYVLVLAADLAEAGRKRDPLTPAEFRELLRELDSLAVL